MSTAAAPHQIIRVLDSREFKTQYGPMKAYDLELEDGSLVELKQKPSTAAPQPGEQIFGTITESERGLPAFKKINPEYADRDSHSPTSMGSAPLPSGVQRGTQIAQPPQYGAQGMEIAAREQNRQKSIVRQHSQQMALMMGQIERMGGKETSMVDIRRWTDWFQEDAEGKNPMDFVP